jgi:hypothetical protein
MSLYNYVGAEKLAEIYVYISNSHNSEILPFYKNLAHLKFVRERQATHNDTLRRLLFFLIAHPRSRMRINTNEQQNKRLPTGKSSAIILRDRIYRLDSHLQIP